MWTGMLRSLVLSCRLVGYNLIMMDGRDRVGSLGFVVRGDLMRCLMVRCLDNVMVWHLCVSVGNCVGHDRLMGTQWLKTRFSLTSMLV